jgi:S-disulfanyl-L-cysteine oxidoreductase SoxD
VKRIWAGLALAALIVLVSCKASGPGTVETALATEAKKVTIGGKGVQNPVPDNQASIDEGRGHFQHHCQICHGLDGHNTGVPFADKMSPPVADLGSKDVQDYADGQLKWIIDNGIRLTGMPGWKGVLEDDEMWKIVRFMRHLPAKGSVGVPEIFKEEQEQHEQMEKGMQMGKPGEAAAPAHSHAAGTPPHKH